MPEAREALFNCQQAAQFLGISVGTVRQWAQTGKIQGSKVGSRGDWRFTRQQLEPMIRQPASSAKNRNILAPLSDERRLKELKRLNLLNHSLDKELDRLTGLVADALSVNTAIIDIIGRDRQIAKSVWDKTRYFKRGSAPLKASYCKYPVATRQPFIVEDALQHPLVADNLGTTRDKIRAYAGVPLISSGNQALGAVCVVDTSPRTWSKKDIDKLATYAAVIMREIELRKKAEFVQQEAERIIKERTAHEERLQTALDQAREKEELFRTLADNMSQLAWMADDTGRRFWYNKRWLDYTGSTMEEMVGYGWQKIHHPDFEKRTIKYILDSHQAGSPWEATFPLRGKDGQYRWFLSQAVPITDDQGRVVRWFGTNTDITDIKQAQEEQKRLILVSRERNELRKLNKAKDEFISLASHQLRTPATAVKQYISILMDGYAGEVNDQQMRYLKTAYNSNERQLNLINELLKTAQLDAETFTLNRKEQDLCQLLQETIDALAPSFRLKNQQIVGQGLDENINAVVDATEVRLVLSNLLENASKYSHPGKTIRASIEKAGDSIIITVTDSGVGIDKDKQKDIFQKFTRIDNELSDTVTGTGLGLYWVKQIVELHGGTIEVASELHKGATFTVTLPV